MKRLRILAVGRLKTPHWKEAAAFYHKRISRTIQLEEQCVKDADSALPLEDRKNSESIRLQRLLKSQDLPICLDETGDLLSSTDLASLLKRLYDSGKCPCFILGGAYGLSSALLRSSPRSLSLGRMTFPHEMARVVLLEQIYRAENIIAGTGYHH